VLSFDVRRIVFTQWTLNRNTQNEESVDNHYMNEATDEWSAVY